MKARQIITDGVLAVALVAVLIDVCLLHQDDWPPVDLYMTTFILCFFVGRKL